MADEGTITPEIRIGELEEALATETERLQKLFAAYEGQEKDLLDARMQLISAKVDENLSVYRLLLQIGRLTADYLTLPVRQYDVKKYYDLVKNSPASKTKSGRELDTIFKSLAKQ